MRAARSVSACLLIALLWPGSSLAQDIDVLIYSDQPGGGSLLAADYDFSEPNAIFLSFCFGGSCLYTTTDPGFRTPDEDRPGESLYAVSAGTDVFLEIVAIDPAVSLQVAGVVIDTPGEAAELGTAQGVHIHPLLQAVVDEGETGVYPVSFKLTGAGYSESATYELLLSNEPAPTPSPSPSPTPTSSPTPSPSPTPPRVDAYLLYKVKPSKLASDSENHKFPKSFNVQLDDVLLLNDPEGEHPDDPENYNVKSAGGLLNPAMVNGDAVAVPDVHYLRYAVKESKQGVGAVDSKGKFPKAVKAPRRLFEIENRFGSIFVEAGKTSALLLPAGSSSVAPAPSVGDHTHYLCYKTKVAQIPSDQSPDSGSGKGSFRKDLQVFAKDAFDDCAPSPEGGTPFPGTAVEGACLLDLKAPRLLCSPVEKSAVNSPRVTSAVLEESVPSNVSEALLCYGTKIASKVRGAEAAALSGLALKETLSQAKHAPRGEKTGTAVQAAPSNMFPSPNAVDTKALELLCLPSAVLSLANLE